MAKNDKKIRMCKLASKGDYETAAALALKAKYICRRCCRVAPKKKNVCKPTEL